MIAQGAEINVNSYPVPLRDGSKEMVSALHLACFLGDLRLKIIALLVESGADLNYLTSSERPPLNIAALNTTDSVGILNFLIKKGAKTKGLKASLSPIFDMIYNIPRHNYDRDFRLECLLESGLKADVKGDLNTMPLQEACEHNLLDAAELLINHGADVNKALAASYDYQAGMGYLHLVAEKNRLDIMVFLLNNGVNIEGIDCKNNRAAKKLGVINYPPLYAACKEGSLQAVQLLLTAGANPNAEYIMINTTYDSEICNIPCLHIATLGPNDLDRDSNLEIVKLLLKYGADVNVISKCYCKDEDDKCKETALDMAMRSGDPKKEEIIKLIKDAQLLSCQYR